MQTKQQTSARLKLQRAVEHIDELQAELRRFKESEPYTVRALHNPHRPELIHYHLVIRRPIPLRVPLIAGDALQNLRSSLDHLAGQLVRVNGKTPDSNTSFPIFDSAKKFEAGANGKIHLMRQDAIDFIKFVEPYKGGTGDIFWHIHRLNNIDKHNLILTTPAQVTQIDALKHLAKMIPALQPLADAGLIFRPDNTEPLTNGSILWTTIEPKPDPNIKFSIDVAFGEPGIVERKPVLATLKKFAGAVECLLDDSEPLLT